jgi:hypothetical protein
MLTSKIVPARKAVSSDLHYEAGGKVHRVFDTNEHGELIPVSYMRQHDSFVLYFAPRGKVFAEITNDF